MKCFSSKILQRLWKWAGFNSCKVIWFMVLVLCLSTNCQRVSLGSLACTRSQFQSLQLTQSSLTLSLPVSAASTGLVCFTNPSLFFSCLPFCPAIFSWLSGSNITIRRRKKKLLKQKSLLQEKFKCHVLNQLLLMCLVNWAPVFYFSKAAGSAGLRFLIFPSFPRGDQGQNSFQLSGSPWFLKS